MKVSEFYKLGRTQPTLDFVDVDIRTDTKVFVDPRALRLLPSEFGEECVSLVQSFFRTVLSTIRKKHNEKAKKYLRTLKEPNETHLGLSRGRSKGRAVGRESATDLWKALSRSEAAKSGLLEDLEDSILMIYGISTDIISDITTNIIRLPLIEYTQRVAKYYGIELISGIDSGPLWNPLTKQWYSGYVDLPKTPYGKLLLIPKAIVRRRFDYDLDEYFRHYILEYLREIELSSNGELVQLLKNRKRRVTKKDLVQKYGADKDFIIQLTNENPEILEEYRNDKRRSHQPALDHLDLAHAQKSPPPDFDKLLKELRKIGKGKEHFADYENAIESILSALFYPSLTNPQVQRELHQGRKRVDIVYTNIATSGFFRFLSLNYSASHIFVECKNYKGDPANPELDQLSGRFSPSRGRVGLLLCRSFKDKDLFWQRCKDTSSDDRGFIIPLDDDDLQELINERKNEIYYPKFNALKERFDRLIM